jgi:Zn-dependent M28 family amino/carboxypeptidase
LSAYFNVDNGTGKIRGIYIEGNDQLRPVFQAWLAPFADMGATTVSIRGTTGTDHENFNAVGLPAFQFIQDPVDYNSRTHHSNMDVYDRVQREDLQQIAAVVASFVYHAATRDELLPRKPLPPPSGRGGKGADKAGDKSTDKGNEKGTSAR